MKRRRPALALLLVALAASGCAVGVPLDPTYVTDTSVTLNGDVRSSVAGDTTYRFDWGETAAYGETTPQRTIAIDDDDAHPVSEPIAGLTADTEYHFRLCVQDGEEDPPRDICSKDQVFWTRLDAGRSGIVFLSTRGDDTEGEIYAMDGNGANAGPLTDNEIQDLGPTWSPDARRIAFSRNGMDLYAMNLDGSEQVPVTENEPGVRDEYPAWSPDGSRIAFQRTEGFQTRIWVVDPDGDDATQLTAGRGYMPAWSPDGRRIAYVGVADGEAGLFVMNADGSNPRRLTTGEQDLVPAWSPDGRRIAFAGWRETHDWRLYVMDSDGGDPVSILPSGTGDVAYPTWSPDGTKIGYTRHDGISSDIISVNPDGTGPVFLNTAFLDFDSDPAWSPRH
jgi:TolB protein